MAGSHMTEWSTHSSLLSATQWGAENSDRFKGIGNAENEECTYTIIKYCHFALFKPSMYINYVIFYCTSWLRLIRTGGSKYEVLTEHFDTRLVMSITLLSAASESMVCRAGLWWHIRGKWAAVYLVSLYAELPWAEVQKQLIHMYIMSSGENDSEVHR